MSISLLLVRKSDFRVADEQAPSSDDLSTLAHPRMASAKVRWLPHSKKERLYKKVSRKMYFPTPLACLIGSGGLFQFKCATDWPRSCLSEKPCEGTHGSIPQAVLLIPVAIAPPALGRARDRFYWKMAKHCSPILLQATLKLSLTWAVPAGFSILIYSVDFYLSETRDREAAKANRRGPAIGPAVGSFCRRQRCPPSSPIAPW